MGYDRHEYYSIAEGELKMSGRYPAIVYTEEGMREGMQNLPGVLQRVWEALHLTPSSPPPAGGR